MSAIVGGRVRRIVIGYDGSDTARRALERAAELAPSAANVVIVTAAPLLYPGRRAGDIVDPDDSEEAQRLLQEARDELQRRGIRVQTHEAAGDPGEAIIEEARDSDADVVIVGTRGRSRVVRLLRGSVSTKVVQGAPCDVLVVR
jgi:nucleotide-binding universal stress UspA family protein